MIMKSDASDSLMKLLIWMHEYYSCIEKYSFLLSSLQENLKEEGEDNLASWIFFFFFLHFFKVCFPFYCTVYRGLLCILHAGMEQVSCGLLQKASESHLCTWQRDTTLQCCHKSVTKECLWGFAWWLLCIFLSINHSLLLLLFL